MKKYKLRLPKTGAIYGIVLFVILYSILLKGNYVTVNNIMNVFRQSATLCTLAICAFLAILTHQIDLSLGSIVSMSGIVLGLLLNAGTPLALAVMGAVLSGTAVGALNGVLAGYTTIPPFIITLATMNIANVVILEGTPATQMNADRAGTATDVCKKYEGVNIVASQPCYANRETAMTTMENILQSTQDIDIVWALNDPTALGAQQAIEAAGLSDIDIVAIDGTPDAIASIIKGRSIRYTMDQAPFDMGAFTVQAAYDILEGKSVDPIIRCGGTSIGPDNAQTHMDTYYPDYEY